MNFKSSILESKDKIELISCRSSVAKVKTSLKAVLNKPIIRMTDGKSIEQIRMAGRQMSYCSFTKINALQTLSCNNT